VRSTEKNVVLVGAGDFCLSPNPYGELKAEILARAMAAMRYDAVVPGERDLAMGEDFMRDLAGRIPVLSCNLSLRGENFGRSYLVLERGGLKIGLVGVTSVRGDGRLPPGWRAADPAERIGLVAGALRDRVDVLIGIFHTGLEEGKRLAAKFQAFDVVVLGHGGQRLPGPFTMGRTIVLKGDTQGRSLGRYTFTPVRGGAAPQGSYEPVPLGEEIGDDPGMKEFLDEYQTRRKELAPAVRKDS
jgi:2',3'-cyclic-nucleotide 2'-phosphodiesterase (5'-nucleotidase family)